MAVWKLRQAWAYYIREPKKGKKDMDGKEYAYATVTLFFNGGYLPPKREGASWYNLCKLPLKIRKGEREVRRYLLIRAVRMK